MSEQVKILQRLPKVLHEQLKGLAKESELSVNAVIVQACEAFVDSHNAPTIAKRLAKIEAKLENGIACTANSPSVSTQVHGEEALRSVSERLSHLERVMKGVLIFSCTDEKTVLEDYLKEKEEEDAKYADEDNAE